MDIRFLHDGERLLGAIRSSPAILVRNLLRALLDALIITAIASVIFGMIVLGAQIEASPWGLAAVFVVAFFGIAFRRTQMWNHARLRITTERILIEDPRMFFHSHTKTIKWPQYQECETGPRTFLDAFFFARPLHFRYGTADARFEAVFPSVTWYAEDLKHYLDKVDSAVRRGEAESLKVFVAKGRGKRDDVGAE